MIKKFLCIVVVFSLWAAGCSDSPEVASTEPDTETKIVSLNPTSTEIIFALDKGDQVVAADSYSDYPAEAPSESGLDAFSPSLEKILEFEPTHVILGAANPEVTEALGTLDIEVITQTTPSSLQEVYDHIDEMGELVGSADAATTVRTEIEFKVLETKEALSEQQGAVIYHEVAAGESNQGYYTNYDETFIGDLYKQLGFVNVATAQDLAEGLLDPETILESNPAIIVVDDSAGFGADAADMTAELISRPGWSNLDAVTNDAVLINDADLSSRGGPRLVEFMDFLVAELS